MIAYNLRSSVRFEHSVCRGSLTTTYIYKDIYKQYIHTYIHTQSSVNAKINHNFFSI